MKRQPVNSTALSSIGYSQTKQILELEFRENGAVWQYANIPADIYSQLIHAESKGNFFVTHIKGHYPEHRIR